MPMRLASDFVKLLCYTSFAAIFLIPQTSVGQNMVIDSVQKLISVANEDTSKVNCFNLLSGQFSDISNYDKAKQYADSALTLADKINYIKGKAIAYTKKGMAMGGIGNYAEGLKNFLASLRLFEELQSKSDIAACYNNIGSNHIGQGNYAEALKNYFLSLKIKKETGDKNGMANSYNNIGIVYNNQGNYADALKNCLTALKLREEMGDKKGMASSYNSIGNVYDSQNNSPEAMKNYLAALKIFEELRAKQGIGICYDNIGNVYFKQGDYSEALKNYSTALKIREEIGAKQGIASTYHNMGNIYFEQGNYAEALRLLLAALKIREEIGNKKGIASTSIVIGGALSRQAALADSQEAKLKYKEALLYFNKGLSVAKEIGKKSSISDAYRGLARLDSSHGNFVQALEHYQLFTLFKDSMLNEESSKQTAQLKIQYETEKKDKEIELLNKENELKAAKVKQQEIWLLASRLEAEKKQNEIIILNANNEVRELQLTEAERKLAHQQAVAKANAAELALTKKDKELKEQQLSKQKLLRNSSIAGTFLIIIIGILFFNRYRISQKHKRQAERMRISSDLHDEVGSTLSSIGMYSAFALQQIEGDKASKAKNILGEISSSSQEMIDDMNDIIWAINPHNDSFNHIVDRLRNYASRMAQSKNITLEFNVQEMLSTISLTMEQRKNLFLICKEAVNNAVKYSGCNTLSVSIHNNNNHLNALITDDGKGFDVEAASEGNGLKNMKQRANVLHASLSIHSEMEKGTRVDLGMRI
jgi:signal transduction histidine kinase/tetratricopeptide (TPR) repeat protein